MGGAGPRQAARGEAGLRLVARSQVGPHQAACQGGGASAGHVPGLWGLCRPSAGGLGLSRLCDWEARVLQAERGGAGPRLAMCPGGGASAGRGRRGHRAHTQSQAQPSSQSAAILNRGVALSFLRNRFLTAGAAASLTGVCSAGVVSLHCALQATETRPSTKEKKR